jgi:hypothetical protein
MGLSLLIRIILRAGIPYGPEVSAEEAASGTTTQERGMAFGEYGNTLYGISCLLRFVPFIYY